MSDGNALSILLNALPSDQAVSLASQLSVVQTTALSSSTFTATSSETSSTTSTSRIESQSTRLPRTHTSITSQITSTSATQQIASTTSSSPPGITAVSATSAAPAAANTPPEKSAGAIAGIATGSVAGIVFIFVIALYLFRRRRQQHWRRDGFVASAKDGGSGSSLLGSLRSFGRSKASLFPEAAWLYDPVRPSSRDGIAHHSNASNPRLGSNVPWSSRPSTSAEERGRPITPAMAELPGSQIPLQHNLSPAVYQPPDRSRSPSQAADLQRFSRPFAPPDAYARRSHDEDEAEDTISPLLPAPARFSGFNNRSTSPYANDPSTYFDGDSHERALSPESSSSRGGHERSRSYVVSADGRTPATRMGRAF